MNLAIIGDFLSKPLSGIGKSTLETSVKLKDMGVDCSFLVTNPVNEAYSNYNPYLNILPKNSRTSSFDLIWGPAHRLPARNCSSLPMVVTIHDLVWKKFPETMNRRTLIGEHLCFSRTIKRADRIVCVSRNTESELHHFFPKTKGRTSIVYHGGEKGGSLDHSDAEDFILFVGTFEPRKNIKRLLIAFSQMSPRERQGLKLCLAGGLGWGAEDPRVTVKKLKLEADVDVRVSPSETELRGLYNKCKFLVYPSLHEGFGLPLVEAMHYGKPILGSNCSSIPEIAGNAGMYFDPQSTSEIKNGLSTLIRDKNAQIELSKNALARSANFLWSKTANNLKEVFEKAIFETKT